MTIQEQEGGKEVVTLDSGVDDSGGGELGGEGGELVGGGERRTVGDELDRLGLLAEERSNAEP